jgi:hypothetical protein
MAVVRQFSSEIHKTYTAQPGAPLGAIMEFPDGRRFRLCRNGGVALVAGRMVQSKVPLSTHTNLACAAANAGTFKITVTLGAAAVAADDYKDGYIYINDAGADVTTEGYVYRIKSHPAAAASATLEVTLYEDSPIKIALTTNSEATLHYNPYSQVIIHPSPPTAPVVGVAPVAVAIGEYFWVQDRGPCAVITDGTVVIAQEVMPSDGVDGAVEAWGLTEGTPNVAITPPCGVVLHVNATGEESLIDLRIGN